jgi:hypothetical protein
MTATSQSERIERLKELFAEMSEKERRDAFYELSSLWCRYCGSKQSRGGCQCMNDE